MRSLVDILTDRLPARAESKLEPCIALLHDRKVQAHVHTGIARLPDVRRVKRGNPSHTRVWARETKRL